MANYGRRTWDREEYAELAKEDRLSHDQALKSSFTDEQLRQLKFKYTDHHGLMKSSMKNVNKKVLATGLSSYKKGKQFGFYCELCDLTFKDTLQYSDHLNHKIHQIKFEAVFDEPLILDQRDNDDVGLDEFSQAYTDLIRQFVKDHNLTSRKENLAKRNQRKNKKVSQVDQTPSEIAKVIGFQSFGTSKR